MLRHLCVAGAVLAVVGSSGCSKKCEVCFHDETAGGISCITLEDIEENDCDACGEEVSMKLVSELYDGTVKKTAGEDEDLDMTCKVK